MSILGRILKHAEQRGGGTVDVPEWGDESGPLVIHYDRVSLAHVAEAARAAAGNPVRQNVEIFVQVARGADGKPLFKRAEVLDLMDSADPMVLGRVMRQMGIVRTEAPDLEGN